MPLGPDNSQTCCLDTVPLSLRDTLKMRPLPPALSSPFLLPSLLHPVSLSLSCSTPSSITTTRPPIAEGTSLSSDHGNTGLLFTAYHMSRAHSAKKPASCFRSMAWVTLHQTPAEASEGRPCPVWWCATLSCLPLWVKRAGFPSSLRKASPHSTVSASVRSPALPGMGFGEWRAMSARHAGSGSGKQVTQKMPLGQVG